MCLIIRGQILGFCIYHSFVWSNLNFLRNSQSITLPTQSCLVLYSFCANLLHLLIMWLIVSSLSPHNLHLLFCCVLSILALIWLVLMALFCVAIKRNSVSLLRFPFLSYIYVFLCEMSLVNRLKHPKSCFSSYFCFLVISVISIVSGGYNLSSSAFFYVVFKLLYWCVNAVFNAGKSSSSFFSWNI